MKNKKSASNKTRIANLKIQLIELNSSIKKFAASMNIFNRPAITFDKSKGRG
jgi:hypothetical protein